MIKYESTGLILGFIAYYSIEIEMEFSERHFH